MRLRRCFACRAPLGAAAEVVVVVEEEEGDRGYVRTDWRFAGDICG
jgi:hypothetical protein